MKQQSTLDNHCFFHIVRLYAKDSIFQLRVMIDLGLPYNLISQDLIAQHRICGIDDDISPARGLNGGGIRLYCQYCMGVESQGTNSSTTFDAVTTFEANITGCKMILGLPWLRTTCPQISWFKDTVLFLSKKIKPFTEKTASLRAQVTGVHNVNTIVIPNSCQDSVDPAPIVAIVDVKECVKIYYAKSLETYLVE